MKNQELIADINGRKVGAGQMVVWWIGQHSFIIKAGEKVIYLDPFLHPMSHRLVAPMLRSSEVTNADFICGTHDHIDHIDREEWPALAQASPRAKFVVPELYREGLSRELRIPLERFVGMDEGMNKLIDGVRLEAVASAHEFLDRDAATGRYPHLGYVISANGCTLYHSGDSCIYEGMQTKLKQWKLDVAFLPINGRDAKRLRANIIGNMTYQEAADLGGALRPGLLVPAHYDMFNGNLADPAAFAEYVEVKYPGQKVHVCAYGEAFVVEHGA